MKDVLGDALLDYFEHEHQYKLWIYNRYGRREEMPVAIYFRNEEAMPDLELTALQACRGTVLDVGAGAGSHSLVLQQLGLDVTAIDISPKAVEVAKKRGVKKAVQGDIYQFQPGTFDTILLLMNGIGLSGSLHGLRRLLKHLKTLLNKGGQLLFDSSDVAYLYKKRPKPTDRYYGEIEYKYAYRQQSTGWFYWLYIDRKTLTSIAAEEGWHTEIMFDDGYDQYLARLTMKA